jgi:integrase
VVRLATILLFTTGMRRGELLNLMVGDYDSAGIDSPHP